MFKLPLVVYIVQIEFFLLVEIYHHHLFNMYISLLYCCTFGMYYAKRTKSSSKKIGCQ